ncbi:hypothetical protein C8R45DRAFT_961024 [Mycena sanguinolenta]|nr:hypothetical protein C8R45DRAFT_961024 [Mycena sanguinolenta]
MLGRIGHICRSLIVPAIVQSPTVIPTILRFAQEVHDDVAPHLSPQSSGTEIIEITKLLWRLVTSFFRNIFWNATGSPAMRNQVPIEQKAAITQMCSRMIEMLRMPAVVQHAAEAARLELIHEFMAELAVFWFLDERVPSEGVNLDFVEEAMDRGKRLQGSPLTEIRRILIEWKKSMYCLLCQSMPEITSNVARISAVLKLNFLHIAITVRNILGTLHPRATESRTPGESTRGLACGL